MQQKFLLSFQRKIFHITNDDLKIMEREVIHILSLNVET